MPVPAPGQRCQAMRSARQRGRLVVLAVVAVIVATGVANGFAASVSGSQETAKVRKPFTLSGTVESLLPGQSGRLRVTVRNTTGRRKIKVVSITATPADAAPGCDSSQLKIGAFSGRLKLRRKQTKTIVLPIMLAADAPEACQGATFPLRFGGRAVRR